MLHLVTRQLRLFCNNAERQYSIARRPLEHTLDQSHQTDLLSKEWEVLLENRLGVIKPVSKEIGEVMMVDRTC